MAKKKADKSNVVEIFARDYSRIVVYHPVGENGKPIKSVTIIRLEEAVNQPRKK